jgi:hypothetical protein
MFSIKEYWSENQIVELLGAICCYGFLNRWNDSMTTELEDEPKKLGSAVPAGVGLDGGKHIK